MIDSTPTVRTEAFRRALTELVIRLSEVDPADFGGVARRSSAPGVWLVESLWQRRETFRKDSTIPEFIDSKIDTEGAHLVRGWVDWAYDRNQFFDLDSRVIARLRRTHRAWFAGVSVQLRDSGSFADFSRGCFLSYVLYAERLSRVFRTLSTTDGVRGRAAEYSPVLQLKLLGLSNHAWCEPVVDLGSGVDAHLVHHLRDRGLSATGIERRGGGPFVLAKDWFEVRFEPSSLGTVISHLAFSLQFLHHHWQTSARAYDYARKYVELLHSLSPGGTFCYAPGLPFIENMLDASCFDVVTLALPEPLATTISSLRDLGTGQSVAYSCQVRRR